MCRGRPRGAGDDADIADDVEPAVKCRIAVRGFVGRKMIFEDRIDVPVDQLEAVIHEDAEWHAHEWPATSGT